MLSVQLTEYFLIPSILLCLTENNRIINETTKKQQNLNTVQLYSKKSIEK